MIKYFVRQGLILGIVSSTILLSWSKFIPTALALSQEQILQKLSTITVFTIGDNKGNMITFALENNKNVSPLYLSQQDAQNLLQELKQKNQNNSYQLLPVTLSEMYQIAKNKGQNAPVLQLFPQKRQVDAAVSLVGNFQGVPLFYATYTQDNQENFLIAKSGEIAVIPLYVDRESLENRLNQIRQQDANFAAMIKIRVMPLAQLIGLLETQDNDAVQKMRLIPTQESLEFLKQLQQQNQIVPSNSR